MTREEAVKEIKKAFEPAFANYIIIALTEGATVSDKELTAKNDLVVDWESYKDVDGNSFDDLILDVIQRNFDCGNTYGYKVADEIIGLLPSVTSQEPIKGHWVKEESPFGWDEHSYQCSECGRSIHLDTEMEDLDDYPYCHCGAKMQEVEE